MINDDLDNMDYILPAKAKVSKTRLFNDKTTNLIGGQVGGSVISGEELFSM